MTFGTLNVDTITNSNGLSGNAIGPGFKNRIINGDMRIDQRNAGAAVTTDGAFSVDRWQVDVNAFDQLAFSVGQDTNAPTGFVNSLKATITTAETTVDADEFMTIRQSIEGTNFSDLSWGSASAKTVTLSFWVRSSVTGTFGGTLNNSDKSRNYPFTYSISAADTWEYKTVTVAGDTTGTWLTTTGRGCYVQFSLAAGATYAGSAGSWSATRYEGATGQTNLVTTLNATWYITGVQLEVGPSATSFDYRPYGTELALCQRYFYRLGTGVDQPISTGYNRATTRMDTFAFFPVTMRAAPTGTVASGSNYYYVDYSASSTFMTNFTVDLAHTQGARLINTSLSGLTNASGCALFTGNASANVGFSAEL